MILWVPKSKIIRFAVLIAVLSVALYAAGLSIVSYEAKKVEDFYRDSESEFSKNARLAAIRSITESNKDLIRALDGYFVQKGDEARFIEEIEKLARDSGVEMEIASLDVKETEDAPFKEDINIKMGLAGGWNELLSFVKKLEKMPFGVSVKKLNFKTKSPGRWFGFVEIAVFREK